MEIPEEAEPQPVFYSQVSAAAMHEEIERLRDVVTKLQREVTYWEDQTNHWYMRANYTPQQIADFIRRRSMTIDEDGEWLPLPEEERGWTDKEKPIGANGSIRYNGTAGRPEKQLDPVPNGSASRPATTRGIEMSYITRSGNLAKTPELRQGDKGPYTYARVLVTDRIQQEDGSYADGPTIAYDVAVRGSQARELVATAQRSGNVRVVFSGSYRVLERVGEQGAYIKHEVKADQVGISLRGQSVTVDRSVRAGGAETTDEFGDDTPF